MQIPLQRPLQRPGKAFPTWLGGLGGLATASLLTGCLYTTHHFNSGRLLEPGQTAVTFGIGRSRIYEQGCPDGYDRAYDDSTGMVTGNLCEAYGQFPGSGLPRDTVLVPQEITSLSIPKFSMGYRLGVRGPWGPLTGVEMGWHIEAVTNPATIEFDLKFGLPLSLRLAEKYHHSVSGGWGVGMWADNSWFAEYAASRDVGRHSVYANYRYTWLATQPNDLDHSFNTWRFASKRGYAHQAALGFYLRTGEIFLIPDYFTPQVNVTTPVVAPFAKVDPDLMDALLININFGFGWNF